MCVDKFYITFQTIFFLIYIMSFAFVHWTRRVVAIDRPQTYLVIQLYCETKAQLTYGAPLKLCQVRIAEPRQMPGEGKLATKYVIK